VNVGCIVVGGVFDAAQGDSLSYFHVTVLAVAQCCSAVRGSVSMMLFAGTTK